MKFKNASKVLVAGVMALGVTVAISTFASDGSSHKPHFRVAAYQNIQANGKQNDQAMPKTVFNYVCAKNNKIIDGYRYDVTAPNGQITRNGVNGAICKVYLPSVNGQGFNVNFKNYYLDPSTPRTQYVCVKENGNPSATFTLHKLNSGQERPKNAGDYKSEAKDSSCGKELGKRKRDREKVDQVPQGDLSNGPIYTTPIK
ncbi:hypothetical protein EXS54_00505 [Patescibacteria group bacterium]|nr:hypothetical protein [Patescibacteria group bacterium]